MSRKSGIATYGYRDQNDFQSSVGLVCEAITNSSSGSDKDIIKQLVESVNLIYNKAIVDAAYNGDNKEFEFNNYYGAEVDRFKFPYLVDIAEYDADSKKIIIKFEDETVDPIEIDLSAIVESGDVDTRLNEEISARTQADQEIWNAIGDLSGSTETSGKTLLELIEEEISARTETDDRLEEEISARTSGDAELWEALITETETRKADDDAIWEAIGSGSTIMDIINEEISARTSADIELAESAITLNDKLDEEISARTENDAQLVHDLGEEINARSQADAGLLTKINNEQLYRIAADEALSGAIDIEKEERISGDTELTQKIADEKAARVYWFSQLSGAITTERVERQSADTELWEALSAETEARKANDETLSGAIDIEIVERKNGDDALSGAVDTEKAERVAADENINTNLVNEKNERIAIDEILSGAIIDERSERIADVDFLSGAVENEKEERIADVDFLSGAILDNQVEVIKNTTSLETNVREEYYVVNRSGDRLGQAIKIYKDSSIIEIYVGTSGDSVNETSGDIIKQPGTIADKQFLNYVYINAVGKYCMVKIDLRNFLVEPEFKDGLKVEGGEVKVRIDSASNPHLTVSESGLRLSGITEIEDNLREETNRAIARETIIENNISAEAANREAADLTLSGAITTEKTERENVDNALSGTIRNEISDRIDAISGITRDLSREVSDRENADQNLRDSITSLGVQLTTETIERSSEDTLIRANITILEGRSANLGQHIDIVDNKVIDEKTRAMDAEQSLRIALNTKANSDDVYYKYQVDSLFATKAEIPTDFYGRDDVDAKDNAIKAMVTAETSDREAENAALNRAITGETQRATTIENTLSGKIDTIRTELDRKLISISNDHSINVDNTNLTEPSLSVNISDEADQIIKLNNDGLYAKATLDYNEEHNELTFTTSNAVPKTISLKTKSSIDNIYYNSATEEIIIEYTVNGTRKEDVHVPVHNLIQEWRVEDGSPNAVALTKDVSGPDVDILRARLVLNTAHTDNVAVIDSNALYVSKNAIVGDINSEIDALKARVTALEQALSAATQVHQQINDVNDAQTQRMDDMDELIDYLQTLHQP